MNFSNIIIVAIVIALCAVPFILMAQNKKKRVRKTLQSLTNIANQQNCTISKHEICGDFTIGIDETKKFVFFIKKSEDKVVEQFINLSEIQNCKAKNTSRIVAYNKENQNVIDKIELCFTPIDKNKKEVSWEFFDADINMQLSGELQSIEQWSKLINDYLKNKM